MLLYLRLVKISFEPTAHTHAHACPFYDFYEWNLHFADKAVARSELVGVIVSVC